MTTTADLSGLRDGFHGRVLLPGGQDYDDARALFNSVIDKRPAMIAQCADVPDVVAAVTFARDHGLPLAVRGGGHSVAGMSTIDDGLVIDMRGINAVTVDPAAGTATVGGGATWGSFDRATGEHGLATTGGRVSTTGVAGLALGGGSGWMERKHGLACDNLVAVQLVTADGRLVTANADENPDLFWALHGGGGNFGVATSLTFRLHPVPVVTLALLLFTPDNGAEMVRRFRDFMAEAPTEVGGGVIYLTGPPEEFVPGHLQGKLTLGMVLTYMGDEATAREVFRPLLALKRDGGMIAEMPYPELQCALDDPPGHRNYWSAEYLTELPDAAIELFCARAHDMIVPSASQHALLPWGGAVARNTGSALADRHATWVAHPLGLWDDPDHDEAAKAWARDTCADLKPYTTGGVYLNFTGDEGADRVVAGFGRDNYARLVAIKGQWDPDNLFSLNHNIRPATTPAPRTPAAGG